jgi:hypothetical protein
MSICVWLVADAAGRRRAPAGRGACMRAIVTAMGCRPDQCAWASLTSRYGNGYPLPETRWVFALLGYGFRSISLSMGLLMGSNRNPTGTWACVCSSTTDIRKPMGF